ncbi:MAG: 5-formyltetrahydrofolate cyclo-ligase [Eggerthellaceae bacterium]|nr:5-formyltetrahydrofolate cyclo-ligase [Eggerthellaceae bacterium]
MTSDTDKKKALRKELLASRAALGDDARASIDASIAENVFALQQYKDASIVFAYASFSDEVDTWRIIDRALSDGKTVVLPRVVPKTRLMRWFTVSSRDELSRSAWGIEEPEIDASKEVDVSALSNENVSLVLVPALAFDAACFRLGYGGGFYDTFLKDFGGYALGLARHAFLFDELPGIEAHDLPVDGVATELGLELSRA